MSTCVTIRMTADKIMYILRYTCHTSGWLLYGVMSIPLGVSPVLKKQLSAGWFFGDFHCVAVLRCNNDDGKRQYQRRVRPQREANIALQQNIRAGLRMIRYYYIAEHRATIARPQQQHKGKQPECRNRNVLIVMFFYGPLSPPQLRRPPLCNIGIAYNRDRRWQKVW